MKRGRRIAGAAVLLSCAGLLWLGSALTAPAPTTILTDRHGAFLAQLGGTDRGYGYWPLEHVPERVSAAILALEDKRFQDHPGVDPLAVARALHGNLVAGRRISGASTIAMQVVRMQLGLPRGYAAKGIEAALALLVTARHGRAAVLKHYLRLVPFGQNSHGIAHAARWYFDKPVSDLSWAEIAFLAAIPQSPTAMNPGTEAGRERARRRGREALLRLNGMGVIDATDLSQALVDLDRLQPRDHPDRPADALHPILRLASLTEAEVRPDRMQATLDLGVQRTVTDIARKTLDDLRPNGARQLAVLLADRSRMEVLAMVGSGRFAEADAGMIDYVVRTRSPGSTLKPFIFAHALERGVIGPVTRLHDGPDSGTGIDNADRRFLGPLLPRQALANSRNVPAALLIRSGGLEQTYWFLGSLGLHDGHRPAERYGLTLSVGGLPTTLERLVTAYGALANDGVLEPLRWYREQDLDPGQRVVSETTARAVTDFLADPMARLPSFARMGATEYPFPAAVKTGTSQGYRDAWVVVYTKRYIIGVWVGRPDGRPMQGLGGANAAAVVARDVLMTLHAEEADGLDDRRFHAPAGYRPASVCVESGAGAGCARELTEFLPATQRPAQEPARAAVPLRPRIVSPLDGMRILRNPEAPEGTARIPLRLAPGSATGTVVWYVNGQRFRAAVADETVHWSVTPGRYRFEARLPFDDITSTAVEITVR